MFISSLGTGSPFGVLPSLWLDGSNPANTGVAPANDTSMGTATTPWVDRSGNALNTTTQATSTKRPLFKTAQLNVKGAISFDGGDALAMNSALYSIPNGDYTVFAVSKQTTAAVADRIFTMAITGNASRAVLRYAATEGFAFFNNAIGAAVSTVTGSVQTRNYNVVCARKSGTTQALSVNGGAETVNTSAANIGSIVAASIGSDGTGSGSFLTGNIAELIIIPRSVSTTEKLRVERYLSFKWGVLIATTITPPSNITAPFDITYNGYSFSTNVDMTTYKVTAVNTYYVNLTTGNNNNDGSAAHPVKSINAGHALGTAGGAAYNLMVTAATFDRNQPWDTSPTYPCNIIAVGGNVILSSHEPLTLVSNGAGAYYANRTLMGAVYDTTSLDSFGDYKRYTLVASEAECNSTSGSWYTDGITVWIHAFNDRDLTGNTNNTGLRPYMSLNGARVTNNIQVYLENIYFYGWQTAAFIASSPDADGGLKVYWNGGAAKYCIDGNNVSFNGVEESILKDIGCAFGYLDGFNYHIGNGFAARKSYEINCSSRNNGWSGVLSNNASTMHDGGMIVRVGGTYTLSEGRNIHDISTAADGITYSFNAGVNSNTSRDNTDSGSVNFRFGDGVAAAYTVAYLVKCLSSGSNKDVYADVDSIVNIDYSSWLFYSAANTIASDAVIQQYLQR